jgi:hypothetical protein
MLNVPPPWNKQFLKRIKSSCVDNNWLPMDSDTPVGGADFSKRRHRPVVIWINMVKKHTTS